MNRSESPRTTIRIFGLLVVGLLVVLATLGYPLLAPSPPTAAAPPNIPRGEQPRPRRAPLQAVGEARSPTDSARGEQPRPQRAPREAQGEAAPPIGIPRDRPQRTVFGEADGAIPDGTTVFDDQLPGVAKLDPALLGAIRQAATAAANDEGIEFYITSGWRSPKYQNQLLREAVATYGSEAEAARWVATADTSPHVSGDAIDIGRSDTMAWLSEHGAEYGLCQIYRNEPWHYELRPDTLDRGCPPMYADPTHDPRMQQ